MAGALVIAAGVASAPVWRSKLDSQPLMRLNVDLGSDVALGSVRGADVILSPDGKRIAYCSRSRLFTWRLDQPKANELTGADSAFAPLLFTGWAVGCLRDRR
jgi:hypothetical protein